MASENQSLCPVDTIKVPKIIWMMWWQGFEDAPNLVKKCCFSWKKHNPGWEIRFLDANSISQYIDPNNIVDFNRRDISLQVFSDAIRINLLKIYGGIWIDATCFCCYSLNDWIGEYLDSGFFAFDKPGRETLISSWFLASHPDSYIISKFCKEFNTFWEGNHFSFIQNRRPGNLIVRWLSWFINRNPERTRLWFSFFVLKVLRLYPYCIFHYQFNKLIIEDIKFANDWEQTKKYSADIPHRLQFVGLLEPISPLIQDEIDSKSVPLYKLNWRIDEQERSKESILDYLFETL